MKISIILLILSVLAVGLSPWLDDFFSSRPKTSKWIHAAAKIFVAYVIIDHVLVASYKEIGLQAAIYAVGGFTVVWILRRVNRIVSVVSQSLGFIGLCIHGISDGVFLSMPDFAPGTEMIRFQWLAISVVFHRVFVSFFIWSWAKQVLGERFAFLWLGLIALSTVVGFMLPYSVNLQLLESKSLVIMQSIFGGMLMSILFFKCYHIHPEKHDQSCTAHA